MPTEIKDTIIKQFDERHPHSQACIETRAKLSDEKQLHTDCIEVERSREREWLTDALSSYGGVVQREEHERGIVQRHEYLTHLKQLVATSKTAKDLRYEIKQFITREEEHLGL